MSGLAALAISEACSIVCAIAAFILAYNGIGGWGWFLLVAVLTTVTSYNSGRASKGK